MKNPIIPSILIVQFLLLGIIVSLGADEREIDDQYAKSLQANQRDGLNGPSMRVKRHLPPQQLTEGIASELGVDAAKFDEIFRNLEHPNPQMTHENAQAIKQKNHTIIAKAFGLEEDTVARAMGKYRPGGPMFPEHMRRGDRGRPVEAIAKELGVAADQFREAFKNVMPAPRGKHPTESQRKQNRKVLSEALGVDPEKLDAVMDKYRPEGPNQRPPRRQPPQDQHNETLPESVE